MAATISCIIRIPIAIFPYRRAFSFLSLRSFKMIMVLLNARASPTKSPSVFDQPNAIENKYPIKVTTRVWTPAVIRTTLPTSLIILGFKPSPIIKSSRAMPILAKTLIVFSFLIRFRNEGPTKIPVKMYPIIRGWRTKRIKREIPAQIAIIILSCEKILESIFILMF